MFTFTVYGPVYSNFIVNIFYYSPPIFYYPPPEVTTAMRNIIFTENQHAIHFLEFNSKN